MNLAAVVILLPLALSVAIALHARRGVTMDLAQWSVGGRGFSALLVFVLMAGELYTTFTFLGASGYAAVEALLERAAGEGLVPPLAGPLR